MKRTLTWFLLILLCGTAFAGGGKDSAGKGNNSGKAAGSVKSQAAKGTPTPATRTTTPSGNRGQGIRLAVLVPDGINFADNDQYLASLVQGGLNTIFSNTKYSAMTIINRQIVDTVLDEQERAASGAYSNDDYIRIGNLTNAQYLLVGTIIKLSANEFSVQLGITNTETGERRTSFTKNCSTADLRQGKVVNEAAVELLAGMGVELSAAEKQGILSGQAGSTEAETTLARGITAQKSGSVIEALNYYYQAASFDSSMTEATGRLNSLTTTITGGNIGEAVQNDYQARMTWLNLFKECAAFYKDHPPFEIVYDPNIRQGGIDFGKGTVNLSVGMALVATETGFNVLNELLNRLEQTGKRSIWGFSGWPLLDVQPTDPAAVVFGGRQDFTFKIEMAIINGENKTITRNILPYGSAKLRFSPGDMRVNPPASAAGAVIDFRFLNVNANDLIEPLTVKVVSVDGIPAETVGERGYIKISVGADELARARKEDAPRQTEEANLRRAEAAERLGFSFTLQQGGRAITITGYTGSSTNVSIPERLESIRITAIEKSAFAKKGLTSVTIPNGVTSIGESAFSENSLSSITISNSVTSIGHSAFYGNKLTSVTIPNSVTKIEASTFSHNQLTSVVISNKVTSIGHQAFASHKLTSVTIPNSVVSIDVRAFYTNEGPGRGNTLTSITIPQGVKLGWDDDRWEHASGVFDQANDPKGFDYAYNHNGKQAGTYILRYGEWVKQ